MRASRLIAAMLAAALPWSGASAACLGMQVHAHRGAPALPENSLAAIRAAYAGAWDGVEIDMQRLRDGAWVLHHDLLTGRTVSGVGRRAVLQLSSDQWRDARLTGAGGGDAALAQQLRATKQREGYLPSGVIIDGDAQAFCRAVGG